MNMKASCYAGDRHHQNNMAFSQKDTQATSLYSFDTWHWLVRYWPCLLRLKVTEVYLQHDSGFAFDH